MRNTLKNLTGTETQRMIDAIEQRHERQIYSWELLVAHKEEVAREQYLSTVVGNVLVAAPVVYAIVMMLIA